MARQKKNDELMITKWKEKKGRNMEQKKRNRRRRKELCLEVDVVTLLETMADELAAIDDKERNRLPESEMREHLSKSGGTILLPIDEHTETDVKNDTDKKENKNNDGEDLTTSPTRVRSGFTTASLTGDNSNDGAAITAEGNTRYSFIIATNDVNDGACATGTRAVLTVRVLDSHALARINAFLLDGNDLLSVEVTVAHGGPETRALANRR